MRIIIVIRPIIFVNMFFEIIKNYKYVLEIHICL